MLGIAAAVWQNLRQRIIAERAKADAVKAGMEATEAKAEADRTAQTVVAAERRNKPTGGGASTDIRPRLYTQCSGRRNSGSSGFCR